MGRKIDDTDLSADPARLIQLAEILQRIENEPVPPQIRDLSRKLQSALDEVLAAKRAR